MSQAADRSQRDMMSPVRSGPVSSRHARSAELDSEKTRRTRRRFRPVRVLEESVGVELPTLTVHDASDLQGLIVYNCRPPLLPVSLRLEDIGPLPLCRTVVSASLAAPPQEDFMAIGGVSPESVAIPELGVAPLVDSDTDLQDELPTPEDSMLLSYSSPEGVRLPRVRPAPADLALKKALISVSVLPVMVTPLVEAFPVAPSTYPEPLVPVLPDDDPGATSRVSPLRVAADGPILDVFPLYLISPACSIYEPVTSPITPSLQDDSDYRPPTSPATMDQYISGEGDLLLWHTADLPLLSVPLMHLPVVDVVSESSVGSPAVEPVALGLDAGLVSGGPL